jgi:hypothetical protein
VAQSRFKVKNRSVAGSQFIFLPCNSVPLVNSLQASRASPCACNFAGRKLFLRSRAPESRKQLLFVPSALRSMRSDKTAARTTKKPAREGASRKKLQCWSSKAAETIAAAYSVLLHSHGEHKEDATRQNGRGKWLAGAIITSKVNGSQLNDNNYY